MKHADFSIGMTFWTGSGKWLCTDIGTRVIVGVHLRDYGEDEKWESKPKGPPYDVPECVFDEYDFGGCYRTEEEMEE